MRDLLRVMALSVACLGLLSGRAAVPFRLPVGVCVTETEARDSGWHGEGSVAVPYVQARARLLAAITASDWRFLHEIPLGSRNDRSLLAFSRGNRELTVMVWRVSVNRSGFSYGLSSKSKK